MSATVSLKCRQDNGKDRGGKSQSCRESFHLFTLDGAVLWCPRQPAAAEHHCCPSLAMAAMDLAGTHPHIEKTGMPQSRCLHPPTAPLEGCCILVFSLRGLMNVLLCLCQEAQGRPKIASAPQPRPLTPPFTSPVVTGPLCGLLNVNPDAEAVSFLRPFIVTLWNFNSTLNVLLRAVFLQGFYVAPNMFFSAPT